MISVRINMGEVLVIGGLGEMETELNVRLSADLVARLLQHGQVCASDFHCIDAGSQRRVRQICLDNLAQNLLKNGRVDSENSLLK